MGERDEWCVSFRAVGPNAADGDSLSSPWSSPRCEERRSDGQTVPEYLPWPAVSAASEGRQLRAGLQQFETTGFLYVDIARISLVGANALLRNCLAPDPFKSDWFLDTRCSLEGKLAADAILDPRVRFIAYRQSRQADGTLSDWIQVSPLIEFAHWDRVTPGSGEPKWVGYYLRDPYIKLRLSNPGSPQSKIFTFVDQYPYVIDNTSYRYQLVYFNNEHKIVSWRQSGWVGADSGAGP